MEYQITEQKTSQSVRQTAYKVWLSNLLNSEFIKEEGEWSPNYVLLNDLKISRVNITATIVDKYINPDSAYAVIAVDDGSACIRLKAFKDDMPLIKDLSIGEMISVIARVRKYENEVYLTPENVKLVADPNWEVVRKLELLKLYGKPKPLNMQPLEQTKIEVQEEFNNLTISNNLRQRVLQIIEKNPEGIKISNLINECNSSEKEVNEVVKELIKEGEIFTPKPGILMVI